MATDSKRFIVGYFLKFRRRPPPHTHPFSNSFLLYYCSFLSLPLFYLFLSVSLFLSLCRIPLSLSVTLFFYFSVTKQTFFHSNSLSIDLSPSLILPFSLLFSLSHTHANTLHFSHFFSLTVSLTNTLSFSHSLAHSHVTPVSLRALVIIPLRSSCLAIRSLKLTRGILDK